MSQTILHQIYRFPFKGFPGQELIRAQLHAGAGIPNDRRFAVTNGAEDTGEWMRSKYYFVNAHTDDMMKFRLDFDGSQIRLENTDSMEIALQLDDVQDLESANARIEAFMRPVGIKEGLPLPRIIDRRQGSMWDYVDTPISIINAETVRAIDEKLGTTLDPLRFRGNLVINNLPAWEEFSWMGKRIRVGNCLLDVHRPIDRCPTPGVNPQTGERDVEVTPGIRDHFGHVYCGMYANVIEGGEIKPGDKIEVIGNADILLEDTFVSNASNYALWPRMAEIANCESGNDETRITFRTTSPWAPPEAKPGQRLKLHLGRQGWTQEYITATFDDCYEISIEDSQTDDPVTKILREGLPIGKHLVISGPYGRA